MFAQKLSTVWRIGKVAVVVLILMATLFVSLALTPGVAQAGRHIGGNGPDAYPPFANCGSYVWGRAFGRNGESVANAVVTMSYLTRSITTTTLYLPQFENDGELYMFDARPCRELGRLVGQRSHDFGEGSRASTPGAASAPLPKLRRGRAIGGFLLRRATGCASAASAAAAAAHDADHGDGLVRFDRRRRLSQLRRCSRRRAELLGMEYDRRDRNGQPRHRGKQRHQPAHARSGICRARQVGGDRVSSHLCSAGDWQGAVLGTIISTALLAHWRRT